MIEPVKSPIIFQNWRNLTFLHWRYPAAVVQKLLPPGLEIETFDGSAWVGVVPFRLEHLRPPWLPWAPWISNFLETNVRTYVHAPGGKSAVWFFSLDAARVPAVVGARIGFGLPYMWAKMRLTVTGSRVRYESVRRWPDRQGMTQIEIEQGEPIRSGDLEIFLAERYGLYSVRGGRLLYAPVEHATWPLQHAKVLRLEQTLTDGVGLPRPEGAPVAHFTHGVDVRTGAPRAI